MDYLTTDLRKLGRCRLTIENGKGLSMSVDVPEDCPLDDMFEAITKLLYGVGYQIPTIQLGYRVESERLDNELNAIRDNEQRND